MLQSALAQVRQAMREVQFAEDQLFEANLEASRARTIIRENGFADILQQKNCIGIKITQLNCSSHFLVSNNLGYSHNTARYSATVPGGLINFSIILD